MYPIDSPLPLQQGEGLVKIIVYKWFNWSFNNNALAMTIDSTIYAMTMVDS